MYHWRAAMEYFLIGMWRQCVPLLDQYDVVGVVGSPVAPQCPRCSNAHIQQEGRLPRSC